jgi:L-rhamnonate dehydratase
MISNSARIKTVTVSALGPPGTPPPKGIGRECITPLSGLDVSDAEMRSGLPPQQVWTVLVTIADEDGNIGVGSAGFGTRVAFDAVVEYFGPMLVGRNPFDVEKHWQRMYLSTLNFGRKGAVVSAISAVDIALWDLIGKILNVPVYCLLGGRTKPAIPVYASRLYATEDLDALHREASSYVSAGYRGVKQRLAYGPRDGRTGMARNLELVSAVAGALDGNVEHMVDAYMGWDRNYAIRMIRMIEDAGIRLAWVEEPLPPDNVAALAEVRRNVSTPIAAGEHEYTRHGVHDLLTQGAVDIIQTDFNRAGGITEAKKIVALASAFDTPVIPHGGQLHNYHVVMSSPECPMAEHFIRPSLSDAPDEDEIFYRIFDGEPDAQNGLIDLDPEVAGLGYRLNSSFVDATLLGPTTTFSAAI